MAEPNIPQALGGLWLNFLSLEFAMRARLNKKMGDEPLHLDKASKGDVVPETPLTKPDTLGRVIDDYNAAFPSDTLNKTKLCNTRNVLAHAKVFSATPQFPVTAVNTKKHPKGVKIKFHEQLTVEWFDEENAFILSAIRDVAEKHRNDT